MAHSYEIIPGKSIGPFKLGMTRDEVLGLGFRPMRTYQGGRQIAFPLVDIDEETYAHWKYPHPGVCVCFDESDNCSEIEALLSYDGSPPVFTLLGHIVNGMSEGRAVELLGSIASDIKYSYANFYSLSAGLRAIKWEAADDYIMAIEVRPPKKSV